MPELRAAAAEAAAAAAAVEQGAVDQPVGQQAQQAEPAAAAAAVEPEAAAGEPSAAAQQAQQQQGAAGQAAAAFERTGSSPLHPAGAKRQRTSPRRSPPKPGPADSGGCWAPMQTNGPCGVCRCRASGTCLSHVLRMLAACLLSRASCPLYPHATKHHASLCIEPFTPAGRPSGSVRFNLPPVQEGAAAAAGGSAEAAADDWWDPLDPEKVGRVCGLLCVNVVCGCLHSLQ